MRIVAKVEWKFGEKLSTEVRLRPAREVDRLDLRDVREENRMKHWPVFEQTDCGWRRVDE